MSEPRPVVVHHPDEATPAPSMSDIERRQLFIRDGRWADWIRNDAGDISGWHHHAANDTYVYVSSGSVTIDHGPGGADSVVARAGDFFIVPSQTIHRETTGSDTDLGAFVIRIGGEPSTSKSMDRRPPKADRARRRGRASMDRAIVTGRTRPVEFAR